MVRNSKSLRTFACEVVGPTGELRINIRKCPNKASALRIFLKSYRHRLREVGITNERKRQLADITVSRVIGLDRILNLA